MPDWLRDGDEVYFPRDRREASRPIAWWRALAVVALTTVIIAVAINAALSAFIWAAFAGEMFVLYAVPIGAFVAACVLSLVATRVTGRFRWGPGLLAPALATAILLVYLARGRGFPIDWLGPIVPAWPAFLLAGVAALAASALLRAVWSRIAGGVAALSVVLFLAVPGIQASWYAADDAAAARAEAEREERARAEREAAFENYLEHAVPPAAPDAAMIEEVRGAREYTTTFLVTSSGAAITTIADATGTWERNDAYPCWILANGSETFPDSATLAELSSWCTRDADGWARTDGTATARVLDGRLVVVRIARADEVVGTREATPEDVAEVTASVRMLTPAEFRAAARDDFSGPTG